MIYTYKNGKMRFSILNYNLNINKYILIYIYICVCMHLYHIIKSNVANCERTLACADDRRYLSSCPALAAETVTVPSPVGRPTR